MKRLSDLIENAPPRAWVWLWVGSIAFWGGLYTLPHVVRSDLEFWYGFTVLAFVFAVSVVAFVKLGTNPNEPQDGAHQSNRSRPCSGCGAERL